MGESIVWLNIFEVQEKTKFGEIFLKYWRKYSSNGVSKVWWCLYRNSRDSYGIHLNFSKKRCLFGGLSENYIKVLEKNIKFVNWQKLRRVVSISEVLFADSAGRWKLQHVGTRRNTVEIGAEIKFSLPNVHGSALHVENRTYCNTRCFDSWFDLASATTAYRLPILCFVRSLSSVWCK